MIGFPSPRATRSATDRRRRAGYTLIEMLAVVTGLVALISVGGSTIVAVRRVATTAQTAADAGTALSRLHRTLRQDAAEAVAATVEEGVLTLETTDGDTIRYDADGTDLRRVVSGPRAGGDRFPVDGTNFRFLADRRAEGVRVALGYDRAGGAPADADEPAVELAAWLPGDGGTEE